MAFIGYAARRIDVLRGRRAYRHDRSANPGALVKEAASRSDPSPHSGMTACAPTTSSRCPAPTAPASSIASPGCCTSWAATSWTRSSSATRRRRRFFLRVHFDLPTQTEVGDCCEEGFASLAEAFGMDWQIHDARRRARLLVLVSRQGHCLNDLLFRAHSGQLPVDIAAMVSNHEDFAALAASYGIPFHHLPITRRRQACAGATHPRAGRARTHRPGGAGALHADPVAGAVRGAGRTRDQHPPQLPAQLQGRQALSPGAPARGQDHRRHRALRDPRPRRRPDHRTGRGARGPQR